MQGEELISVIRESTPKEVAFEFQGFPISKGKGKEEASLDGGISMTKYEV